MTLTLEHTTILIIAGRSIAGFRLQKDLEDAGAAVSVTRLADLPAAVRNVRPNAVIVDFSLASVLDGLDDLEAQGIPHLVSRSPNKSQTAEAQAIASQYVVSAMTGLVERRGLAATWQEPEDKLDPDLYAI